MAEPSFSSPRSDPVVSVIIVNYNGKRFLDACIESIPLHLSVSHEIVVVDNASSDDSVEHLRSHHPGVEVVASTVNGGFAAGNNLGARHARGRYLLLLNNDTVVSRALDEMVLALDGDPSIGALGCCLIYPDGSRQESIGLEHETWRLILSWTPLERILPIHWARRMLPVGCQAYGRELVDVAWISGACLMTRSEVWGDLAGLDERYFMYAEDTDYCRRVRDAGWRVCYTDRAGVIHFEGAGRPWRGRRAIVDTARSYMVYADKFGSLTGRVALRTLLPAVFVLRSLAYLAAKAARLDPWGAEKAGAFLAAARVMAFRRSGHG